MLKNLSTKVNQMSTALNMAGDANRENLLGSDSKTDDIINRASGLDNQGLVGFQRQTMRGTLEQILIFFWLLWFSNYVMLIQNLFCVKNRTR